MKERETAGGISVTRTSPGKKRALLGAPGNRPERPRNLTETVFSEKDRELNSGLLGGDSNLK